MMDKYTIFNLAHDNSLNHVVRDNGRGTYYRPSPTVCPVESPRTAYP